jgi:hypothetical protein
MTQADELAQRTKRIGAIRKLVELSRASDYTPVAKVLHSIGITPSVANVMIDGEEIECMVVPTRELIEKEWLRMTGGFSRNGEAG